MSGLLAPTALRIAPAELRGMAHQRFGGELRRAGSFAQLTLLGARACLEASGTTGSLGLLWGSLRGAVLSTQSALGDLRRGDPVMPFTFVGTQPHLGAALFAQLVHPLARSAFLYFEPGGEPGLLPLAGAWLADCDRVLIGRVEESVADGVPHESDWGLLARTGAISSSPPPA
jgi:hypothetical protein